MDLRFAFAVNDGNQFQKKHFGDADKFLIYESEDEKIVLLSEEPNSFKLMDEGVEHGSKKKGKAIIEFLKQKDVHVLVSQQFGKNMKLINEHFIPAIVYTDQIEEVFGFLTQNLEMFKDEWLKNESNFKLVSIKESVINK